MKKGAPQGHAVCMPRAGGWLGSPGRSTSFGQCRVSCCDVRRAKIGSLLDRSSRRALCGLPANPSTRLKGSQVSWRSFRAGLSMEKRSCVSSTKCSVRVWKGIVAKGEEAPSE